MIKTLDKGTYLLVRTKDHKTLLYLGEQSYLWNYAPKIGELLTFTKHEHQTDFVLARGDYRISKVKDEPDLVDLEHLELSLGKGTWQGYLLLTGLPTVKKIRSRIVPTGEIITSHKRRRHKK
jgi:hypothetical protein